MANEPILEVEELTVNYGEGDNPVRAVERVSFSLFKGEFLGLVGESACGKSTLCFAIAQLLSPPAHLVSGKVVFLGQDLAMLHEKQLRRRRWIDFSVVMQSAMNALNPVMTIGDQIADAIRAHERTSRSQCLSKGRDVLKLVGIDPIHLKSYPHQLSGGMRQRAMIAMAMVFTPDLIIMDEPTSALDVVAQRSLMMQIKQLQRELGFAVIFVTHDMSVVGRFSDRLAIMYAGEIVEMGATASVFRDPKHPYTQGLLRAFPSIHGQLGRLEGIPGSPPDLRRPPSGCRFRVRCPAAMSICASEHPPNFAAHHDIVRCFLEDPAIAEQRALERQASGL